MIPHWFRSPKALILIPILLLLLGAVACGPAEESAPADTQAKDTAPSDTKTDTTRRMSRLPRWSPPPCR